MESKKIALTERPLFVGSLTFLGGFCNAYTFVTRDGAMSNMHTGNMSRKTGYGIGMQCLGYVGLLSDLTFGTDAPIYSHGNFDKVRPGDHVRLVLWDHSMLVTRVCKDENGRTYFYATDVNADYDTCMTQWERKFTKEELRRLGDYVCVYTRYPQE